MRLLIGLFWLVSTGTQAVSINSAYEITNSNLKKHVVFLSSKALEGRLTGSPGEKLSTKYIANMFKQLGLEPAGDKGSFFQTFNFASSVSLGKNNSLAFVNPKGNTKHLILEKDWLPISFSNNASFIQSEFLFAGYGIKAPSKGKLPPYNSYSNLNVNNKWVVVLHSYPLNLSGEQRQQIQSYSSLRYKTFIAKTLGAKGIIFVNNSTKDSLIPFSHGTSLINSGIVALTINKKIMNTLLANQKHRCNSLEKLTIMAHSPNLCPTLLGIQFIGRTDIKKNIKQGRNVLAKLTINPNTTKMLIIGAHADHLGRGQLGSSRSRNNEHEMIHPGADDNASGVAALLEIAANLRTQKAQGKLNGNKNILFAAWSGEELGILGSTYFINNFRHEQKSLHSIIEAMINLDMIGHLREKLVIQGLGSSMEWLTIIKSVNEQHQQFLITQNDPYLPTDSTAFYLQGIPILNFFTGAHDDYHSPRDRPETLNYQGIKTISQFLINLIVIIEKKPQSISYQLVNRTSHAVKQGFKVYLGTIPDYTSTEITGLKLSGVTKNSPAELAGLKQGDIIIELAQQKINDIYDYTYILNSLMVGEPTKLVVLRNQTRLKLSIIAKYKE
jgi:hypothetical protein